MRSKGIILGAAAVTLTFGPMGLTEAQAVEPGEHVLYGIDRDTSEIWRHDFSTGEQHSLGPVRDEEGNAYEGGIDGAAYAYGNEKMAAYSNIFAFRWDEYSYAAQMLWVDVRNGEAAMGNDRLEGGPIGGANAVAGESGWEFYAVQHEKVSPPFHLNGTIALSNPNNSRRMAFELVMEDGEEVTRSDLKNATQDDLDADGNLTTGIATQVRVRPMGQGNQNNLTVTYPGEEPEEFDLRNSNTYVFIGTMEVRLHNPQLLESGNSMGDWFLEIDGSAYMGDDDVEVLSPHRLVHITHHDDPENDAVIGTVTEMVELSRPYDSVATLDGDVFYAGHENDLWKIDVSEEATQVETLVHSSIVENPNSLVGMDFAGEDLYAFAGHHNRLKAINVETGEEYTVSGVNLQNLGTLVFTPAEYDRHAEPFAAD